MHVDPQTEETLVRIYLTLPLIAVAGCNIESDATNEQVTLEYNKQQMKEAAVKARRTAEDVASGVGNVAASTGRAIKNEVGDVDVDVDVDVDRNRTTAPK